MNKIETMEQIEKNVKNCQKCRLYKAANHPVPGEGDINAEIIFIGEAPGANEDATGRPFVGRAGKLLERLLAKIGYKRDQVWIGNIIKHRPPSNRDPMPDEIRSCVPYLNLQLKTLDPILIVTLGRFAMNFFYPEGKISRDRGRLIKTKEYYVYPVYHPAAGLRSSKLLNDLKEDFLKIPQVLQEIKNGQAMNSQEEDTSPDGQLKLF
jgi:DNA polymerase